MSVMSDAYGAAAERLLHFVETRTTDQTGHVMRVPVSHYLDPVRWKKEVDLIFKHLPLALALTIELPEPGNYKAMEPMGLPVLITRAKDGVARAFLNVCKHRSMKIVNEGKGNCTRFACPYHGWTYANDGRLIGISEASTFGDVDKSELSLTELPCQEVAGIIFVILTPRVAIDVKKFLGGMHDDLVELHLEKWFFLKSRPMTGANWKVTYDGYLEGYHFQSAHPHTVTPRTPSNRAFYEAFGPHVRLSYPQHRIVELRNIPREQWGGRENLNYDFIRMLFPNFALFLAPEMCQIAQLFPGDDPGRNVTIMNYLYPRTPASDREHSDLDRMSDFFYDVVEKEDYQMGLRVQQGLEARAADHVTFGRNELGNQYFHKWVDYYLAEGARPEPQLRD